MQCGICMLSWVKEGWGQLDSGGDASKMGQLDRETRVDVFHAKNRSFLFSRAHSHVPNTVQRGKPNLRKGGCRQRWGREMTKLYPSLTCHIWAWTVRATNSSGRGVVRKKATLVALPMMCLRPRFASGHSFATKSEKIWVISWSPSQLAIITGPAHLCHNAFCVYQSDARTLRQPNVSQDLHLRIGAYLLLTPS